MSNIIKGGRNVSSVGTEGYRIDSNAKADMMLSGLRESVACAEVEQPEGTVLPPAVEAAIREQASLILNEAKAEERRIMDQALKEAKIRKQSILDAAREEGYRDGYGSGIHEIRQMEDNLKEKSAFLQQEYERQIDELKMQYSGLVIRFVEKLTGVLAEEHRPIIAFLMKEAVLRAEPSKKYIVHVAVEDAEEAETAEAELRKLISAKAVLEIQADHRMSRGDCRIETDSCIMDSGLNTRLGLLRESLRLLTDSMQ